MKILVLEHNCFLLKCKLFSGRREGASVIEVCSKTWIPCPACFVCYSQLASEKRDPRLSFKDSTFYQKIDWIGLNFVISSKSNEPVVFISACMLYMNLYSFKNTQSSEIAHNEIIDMYVFSDPDTLITQLVVMSQSSHILRKELFLAFFSQCHAGFSTVSINWVESWWL